MANFILIGRGGLLTSTCLEQLVNKNIFPMAVFIQDVNNSPYINLTEIICKKHSIAYYKDESVQNEFNFNLIKMQKPDFAIVASLGEILQKPFLELLPIYNIHMGVLPYYRGAFTNFWKILKGDDIYGVTVHKMQEKVDSGNALVIMEEDFSEVVFAPDFFKKNYLLASKALIRAIEILNTNNYSLIDLDYSKGVYYRKHKQSDMIFDVNEDLLLLHKKINRIQYYGTPTIEDLKVYSTNLLLYSMGNSKPVLNKVNENKYILTNPTGVLELNTL